MKKTIVIIAALLAGVFSFWLFNEPKIEQPTPLGIIEPVKERKDLLNWNVLKAEEYEPNKIRTVFYGGWVRYLNAAGDFQRIQAEFTPTPAGFEMLNAPFEVYLPLTSTGIAKFRNNNRFDNHKHLKIDEPAYDMEIQAQGVADVAGVAVRGNLELFNGTAKDIPFVIYPNVFPDTDLIYYVHEGHLPILKKLVIFRTPTSLRNVSFKLKFFDTNDFFREVAGKQEKWQKLAALSVPKGKDLFIRKTENRGVGFEPFKVWDSATTTKRVEEIQVDIQPIGNNEYTLTKIIPLTFATALFPVYTDVNVYFQPAAGANAPVDGNAANGTDGSFASMRSGSGTASNNTGGAATHAANISAQGTTDVWDAWTRSFILFDTSSIGAGNTVDIATTTYFVDEKSDGCNVAVSVRLATSTIANNASIVNSDYQGTVGNNLAIATDKTIASLTTAASSTWLMNATGRAAINMTTTTPLGFKIVNDANNDSTNLWAFACVARMTGSFADVAGTNIDPTLEISYSANPTGGPARNKPGQWFLLF